MKRTTIRVLALAGLLAGTAMAARAEPVLPIDIRNASDCDISITVAPHPGAVAAPAGQTSRLLIETPPQADGSNSIYRLSTSASAEGCDAKLQKPAAEWVLVRSPDGSFYVDPKDPAAPDPASGVGSGTPTFILGAPKDGEIPLTLTTE